MKRSKVIEELAKKLLHTHLFGINEDEREENRVATKMVRLKIAHETVKALEEMNLLPPNLIGTNWRGKWDKE